MPFRPFVAGLLLCALAAACDTNKISGSVKRTDDRSRRLTLLAAVEAGNIGDADARLTRQLNIAEMVLRRFGPQDGLLVLAEVTKTLHSVGPQLNSHARLSGWVSVSQLSRRAQDLDAARLAATEAERALEALESPAERCQYVMGVAEEVSQLQGDDQAAAMLAKGGGWASAIEANAERRSARLAFAVAMFNLNAYEGGVATLQLERDATWSSDTMLALAAPVREEKSRESFMNAYGQALGYEQVFQHNETSKTAH